MEAVSVSATLQSKCVRHVGGVQGHRSELYANKAGLCWLCFTLAALSISSSYAGVCGKQGWSASCRGGIKHMGKEIIKTMLCSRK